MLQVILAPSSCQHEYIIVLRKHTTTMPTKPYPNIPKNKIKRLNFGKKTTYSSSHQFWSKWLQPSMRPHDAAGISNLWKAHSDLQLRCMFDFARIIQGSSTTGGVLRQAPNLSLLLSAAAQSSAIKTALQLDEAWPIFADLCNCTPQLSLKALIN